MKRSLNINESAYKFTSLLQRQRIFFSAVCFNIFREFHFYIHVIDIAPTPRLKNKKRASNGCFN
jgi:hypothetical protein